MDQFLGSRSVVFICSRGLDVLKSPPDESINDVDFKSPSDQSLNEPQVERQYRNSIRSRVDRIFSQIKRQVFSFSRYLKSKKFQGIDKVVLQKQVQNFASLGSCEPRFYKSEIRHRKESKGRSLSTPKSTPARFPQSIDAQKDDKNKPSFLVTVQDISKKVRQNQVFVSKYSHRNQVSENKYQLNCYGFVCYCIQCFSEPAYKELLKNMAQMTQEKIPRSIDGIPCPFNLSAIIKKDDLQYWNHIQSLEEVKSGDIIVYLPLNYEPPSLEEPVKKGPTYTHVMVVNQVFPKTDNEFFHFSIIDCTRKPHSKDDTRQKQLMKTDGIGQSELLVKKNEEKENCYTLQWKGKQNVLGLKELTVGRVILA